MLVSVALDLNAEVPAPTVSERPAVAHRLLAMGLALAAPATLLIALLAFSQYAESQSRFSSQLVAMTRALALATDRQIGQGQSVLQGLAVSPTLAAGDLRAFEVQARGVTRGDQAWILLIGPEGQRINTLLPPGAVPPAAPLPVERWTFLRQGRTSVSNLAQGSAAHGPIIAIDMPVLVRGQLHTLSYVQRPSAFYTLFAGQHLPSTWTGAIVDRNAALVARSRDQDRMVGRLASVDMRRAMAASNEGLVRTQTLDGVKTLSAFSRSPASGWTFIVGVPRRELAAATWISIVTVVGGAAVMIILGALSALAFARPISREVRALVLDARRLASGLPVEVPSAGLRETMEVRQSLVAASNELRRRDLHVQQAGERQQLMINELNHRVKNTLVIVQSLARHSLRNRGEAGLAAFNDRLHALARAHDLLTRRIWEGADLREVLEETLEPYRNQIVIDGPSEPLQPNHALALAMIFHELATNAAKYGALSAPSGQVEIAWTRIGDRLDIVWRETGGPRVTEPTSAGFGSRLIGASLKGDLQGSAAFDYAPDGLTCRISIVVPAP